MLRILPATRTASRAVHPQFAVRGFAATVPLTGDTLNASIKMRCDTSGACYSLYWEQVNDEMVVKGGYNTPERAEALKRLGLEGYVAASKGVKLNTKGEGPVATVHQSGKPLFKQDVEKVPFMVRKKQIQEYGIQSCVWIPFEAGVLEYGTAKEGCPTTWTESPVCPTMPKAVMRSAFEEHGAKYVIFWELGKDGNFHAVADYVTAKRRADLYKKRGDHLTFCSESRGVKLPADGDGPCATAARTGERQALSHASEEATFKRAALAKEFGVKSVHFVPVEGGVLEYGIPVE